MLALSFLPRCIADMLLRLPTVRASELSLQKQIDRPIAASDLSKATFSVDALASALVDLQPDILIGYTELATNLPG